MATTQSTKAQTDVKANATGTPNGSDDRFTDVATDRKMYDPNKCGEHALIGYLIDLVPMPPADGKAWSCFVVRTTEPTKALDRSKTIVDVPVGEEIMIPATQQIRQALEGAATQDRYVFEVWIKPKAKVSLGGGKTQWTWTVRRSKAPKARQELNLMPPMQIRALPAAGGSTENGDDSLPF